jgi:hypothetical protein
MLWNYNYPDITINSPVNIFETQYLPSYPRTGSTIYDLSGSSSNGTLSNSPTYSSSGCLTLDGIDDIVSCSATLSTATRSVEIIYKLYSPGSGWGPLWRVQDWRERIFPDSVNLINDGGTYYYLSGPSANTDVQNICYCYTGTSIKCYKNGVLISSQTMNGEMSTGTFTYYFGNQSGGSTNAYVNMDLYSVKFYNSYLTDAQVAQNYYKAKILTTGVSMVVDPINPVSNKTSTTIRDLTGNAFVWNYEGTVTNSTNWGGCIYLNSGRMYRDSLSWYGNYTLQFWVKWIGNPTSMYWYTESYRGGGGCARVYSTMNSDGSFTYQVWDNSSASGLGQGTRYCSTTTNVQDGNWHQITCIWSNGSSNRTRGVYVYCDGVQEGYMDMIGNDGSYSSMHLGGVSGCLGESTSTCYIGPVLQYNNVALADSDIKNNYNAYSKRYR